MMIDRDKDGNGVVEASDIGWRPGHWPNSFVAQDDERKYVKRSVERELNRETGAEGDVLCVKYINGDGTVIRVLND